MRGTGAMTFSMETVKSLGPMVQFMKDLIWLVKSTVWVSTPGMTEANILESGLKIKLKDLEHIAGLMEDSTKVSG